MMNPILLDLGIIKIYWYSLFIFIAFLIGGWFVLREAKRFSIPEDYVLNMFFWTIPIAIIGARLYYVIFNWSMYASDPISIFKIWEGGLAIHGGIILSALFILIYTKKYCIPTLFMFDFIVVGLIIGQAIGRWGNFFNAEAHGGIVTYETLKSLFIPEFIIKGMNINGVYYHPTFLYESLWCILGFIVLIIMRRMRYTKTGQVTCMYMIWYGLGRFFIEMMRTDSLMLGTFKVAQIVSAAMFVIGVIGFIILGSGSKFNNLYEETSIGNIKF